MIGTAPKGEAREGVSRRAAVGGGGGGGGGGSTAARGEDVEELKARLAAAEAEAKAAKEETGGRKVKHGSSGRHAASS